MISEIKLDEWFPQRQFKISRFSRPIRRDRNSNGGRIMLFVRKGIPAKLIFSEFRLSKDSMWKLIQESKSDWYVFHTTLIDKIQVKILRHWVKALIYFPLIMKIFVWW